MIQDSRRVDANDRYVDQPVGNIVNIFRQGHQHARGADRFQLSQRRGQDLAAQAQAQLEDRSLRQANQHDLGEDIAAQHGHAEQHKQPDQGSRRRRVWAEGGVDHGNQRRAASAAQQTGHNCHQEHSGGYAPKHSEQIHPKAFRRQA
jgi:hypothetical protein